MQSSLLLPTLIISCFLLISIPPISAESSHCLAVYKEGGAPAVFQSPRCPRWTLSSAGGGLLRGCHVAVLQGRRASQEDRAVCALGLRVPFLNFDDNLGKMRIKEIDVGIIAVFDGHNGAEVSDLASKLLLEYFLLHVYFLLDGVYSILLRRSTGGLVYKEEDFLHQLQNYKDMDRERLNGEFFSAVFDDSLHFEVLKESLVRTIHDIDSTFSKEGEAILRDIESGSTATVVIISDGHFLSANVGDSKAFLCSKDYNNHHNPTNLEARRQLVLDRRRKRKLNKNQPQPSSSNEMAYNDRGTEIAYNEGEIDLRYFAKELTVDHHPDREDERRRIEEAGGRVFEWAGVVRVNGQLSLSRAIGDLPYKQYGVISTPEMTGWHQLYKNDTFIVVASDGVFEKMTTQNTCDFLLRIGFSSKNLAELLLSEALERGTMDNVAAVVVPLGPVLEEGSEIRDFGFPVLRGNEFPVLGSSILEKDYFDLLTARFHSSLVEAKNKRLGCFYLSESLDEYTDYIFQDPNYDSYNDIVVHNSFHNSEPIYSNHHPVGLYKEHDFCWFFGLQDEEKDHCTNLYSFSKFIGLLDSLPNTEDFKSDDSSQFRSDFRYKLRRKFDRGSYGEVWLAFHWNCTQDISELKNSSQNYCNNSKDCFKESASEDLFILKRIMVERGNAAYKSGLREKYFGELFLNESNSLITTFLTEEESAGDLHFKTNYTNKSDEGLRHIARFVESFVSKSNEIWLVYKNEGISLSKMVYSAEETRAMTGIEDERERYVQVVRPSEWWYWLRTSQEGQKQMQDIIRQLLMSIKACHDRNITHRDVKPENMIICFEDVKTGKCSREIPTERKQKHLHMRLIDFGSAIDDFTIKHLYGTGPTRSEQTYEYTPPEGLLNPNWFQVPNNLRMKYDIWSVGVVMLELILGSPHVFLISDRTRALLDQQLEGWSESTRELAYKLRSYMELCILIPGTSSHHHHHSSKFDHGGVSPASWKCSEESFSHQVKMKDPLKLGFPNIWALRLVRQLLVWHPEGRLSVDEALNHPYFQQD